MQWNRLDAHRRPHRRRCWPGSGGDPWVYFVHSYAPEVGPETVATCDYGGPVAAAAERDHVWGTQFHPEKSGRDRAGHARQLRGPLRPAGYRPVRRVRG